MLEKCFILLWAAALLSAERLPQPEGRIIGGDHVPIKEVPWQVALIHKDTHRCGGTIYNEWVILTAAHCLVGVRSEDLFVRAGSSLRHHGGQLVPVKNCIMHEDSILKDDKMDNDIAVLLLAVPLQLGPEVLPIELAEKSPLPGTNVLATGWGTLHDRPFQFHKEILLGTNLTIVDHNVCSGAYFLHNVTLTKSSICAHGLGRGICRGDSGGPVVTLDDRRLIGVVSGVARCAGDLPEFYADVQCLGNGFFILFKHILVFPKKY